MISGSVVLESEKIYSTRYVLTRRLPKLLVPLIVWSAIAILIKYLTSHALSDGFDMAGYIREIFYIPTGSVVVHLWFMYVLTPIHIISPFSKEFSRKYEL